MKTILFQGDSITDCGRKRDTSSPFVKAYYRFKGKTDLGSGYAAMVADELKGKGAFSFYNRGVGGDRILDVYARIVRDIIHIKPDFMSLLVGVNDVWHGFDLNNGTGTARFEKIFDILLDEIRTELPDTKLIVFEPFVLEGPATADRDGQPDRYKKFRSSMKEVSEIEKRLCEKYGVKFIELQAMFDEKSKTVEPTKLLSDGVHPTKIGHELIKNEWIKAYKELM